MFLFSADSGARPVPLNSCSDVLLHLRKRARHGHLELKCWINPTESFQIAQVLFCSVNFCSFRLAVLRLHGLRLCTQAVHSHLQAPRSGRGALRRGPERGLFWQNFYGILMCKDSNDTVAREPYLSTLLPAPAALSAAHSLEIARAQGWKIRFPSDRIIRIFEHQNSIKILSEFSKIITIFRNSVQILKILGLLNIF